ncbi:hypothetical protein RBB50_007930 [Rhinocladiella similis]
MSKILVLGTGCIGSNYDAVKAHGLRISSTIFGDLQVRPTVVRNVAEAIAQSPEPFDFVVVCTKATKLVTETVIQQIKSALTAQRTSIILIQNGLGVERPFHNAFPETTIISAVAYLPTTQVSPGVFVHSEVEILHLGLYPSAPASKPLVTFAELIRSAGATSKVHDDVQAERWCKIVANGTVNPICALSRCRDRRLAQMSSLATALFRDVMQEIASVAAIAGYGHVVTSQVVEAQLSRTLSRPSPGVQPSMMSDALDGRPMEVQAIVGEIVKIATDNGIHIPHLATLYVLLEGLDQSLRGEADE